MKTFFLIVLIAIITLATSCRKDDIVPADVQKPQNMKELVASPSFDWKTTKEYTFYFQGNYNSVLKIISNNGIVYHRGVVKINSPYTLKLALPSSEKSVRLIYYGQDTVCLLSQSIINFSFNSKK